MREHTPGPWTWGIRQSADPPRLSGLHVLGNSERSVVVHQALWDVCEADARLIAAAPDLLDEAERTTKALNAYMVNVTNADDRAWLRVVTKGLEGAIAKARGEP